MFANFSVFFRRKCLAATERFYPFLSFPLQPLSGLFVRLIHIVLIFLEVLASISHIQLAGN